MLKSNIRKIYTDTIGFLESALSRDHDIAVITGSGISGSFRSDEIVTEIPYERIPGLPVTGVAGHSGALLEIRTGGCRAIVFAGRFHHYEGRLLYLTLAPIILSSLLGAKSIILTNAAGGLNPGYQTGDLMLIEDTIDFSFANLASVFNIYAASPEGFRRCFFDTGLRKKVSNELGCMGKCYPSGVYVQVPGPSYETPAEIGMYCRFGADAIGMSTAIEAKAAWLLGMKVTGCSLISNTLSETDPGKLSHEDVLRAADSAKGKIRDYFSAALNVL